MNTGSISTTDVESIQAELRGCGLRATPARVATVRLLRSRKAPLSHAEVTRALEPEGFDKATLFRNLNDLSEVGLLRRTELGDHVWRFEACVSGRKADLGHPHFICVDCGSVTCLDQVELSAGIRKRGAGIGKITEILLRGHCQSCQ